MDHKIVEIASNNNEIQLLVEILDVNKIQEDSLKIQIEYRSLSLTGIFSSWIESTSLKEFIKELEAIEKIRKGKAELESMSPGEIKFTIENYDSAGHFGIKVQTKKEAASPEKHYIGLTGFIDIGSEYYLSTLESFKELNLMYESIEPKIKGIGKYGKNF